MDKQTKCLLGKIIGEIYKGQRNSDAKCDVGDGHIYGLLNGFEDTIDEEIENIGFISKDKIDTVVKALSPIFDDDEKLKAFKGFYDIEKELKSKGVSRTDAMKILTQFYAEGAFVRVIDKMDSEWSPSECRTFKRTGLD